MTTKKALAASSLRSPAIVLWLFIVPGCALYCVLRLSAGGAFDSNILSLLPANLEEQQYTQLAHQEQLQRRFVLLVSGPDPQMGLIAAHSLQQSIEATNVFKLEQKEQLFERLEAFYRAYRHQLLTPEKRRHIESTSPEDLAAEVVATLYSPVRPFQPYSFADDPFNLGGAWLEALLPLGAHLTPGEIPSLQQSNTTWYLVSGEVSGDPFDPTVQQPISALVTDFRKAFPQAQLLTSGFIFHAAAGTTLAKKEMNTVGTGSLLAIVILVLAVFRTRQALLAILLTLTSAVVVALAASLAVFGQIHLLTLAFGSTLLGLAVDYCFHFLLTYRRTGTALRAGRAIGRGLLLSVFSSVAAYSLQLISPFPGLQQFAVFVSSGLLGAAAFIGLLTLCYKEPAARPLCPGLFERTIGPRYPQLSRHTGLVYLVVIGLIAGSAWTIHNAGTNDDLRQLNTSGSDLLASEQQVQALIGGLDSQRYWVIRGDDSQQVLSRTAEFMASLQNPAMAITQLVPPLVQQQYDYRLIRTKLYGSEGALKQLCLRLQQPCSTWLEQQRPFIAGLIPAHLPNDFTRYFPTLATGNDHQRLVFPFLDQSPGEATPAARFSADWLHYVDKVRNISDTLTGFRLQVSQLVAGFLALFSLAAFALYRWRGVALVACVVTSLSVALALSATAGITLFHILALLLVMGIALDTAIFYLELGLTAHTWGAATLSTLTSVLAFGLLSLSQVPVLNQFGSVVFIGLLCTWLLAPILYCTSSAETCGFKE